MEDLIHRTRESSQNGRVEAQNKSRGFAQDGENVCEELHERLIITRDGIAKEEYLDRITYYEVCDQYANQMNRKLMDRTGKTRNTMEGVVMPAWTLGRPKPRFGNVMQKYAQY